MIVVDVVIILVHAALSYSNSGRSYECSNHKKFELQRFELERCVWRFSWDLKILFESAKFRIT